MANKALGLYRQILRAAKLMPTENRRLHIVRKARAEFDKSKQADPQQREFLLALADTQIDSIEAHARACCHGPAEVVKVVAQLRPIVATVAKEADGLPR